MQINYKGVTVDLLSAADLVALTNQTKSKDSWLVDTFFSRIVVTEEDKLAVGSLNLQNPIAPYVSPCVEGRPIRERGTANVSYVDFAYLKPKMSIEPCKVKDFALLNKLRGFGRTDTEFDFMIDQVQKMEFLRDSIDNRVNKMAAEVFATGKLIVASDDQPHFEVDFGRDPACNFTPLVAWTDPTSTPVQDIQVMAATLLEKTGNAPTKLVMRTSVWNALVKHNDFNDRFVKPYAGISVPIQNQLGVGNGAIFKCYMDNIEVWVYDGSYTDENGLIKFYLPDNFCGLVSEGQGVRAFGRIQDFDANLGAMQYFTKMWMEQDPSILYLMMQSAPMVVPASPNQVVGGTAFI